AIGTKARQEKLKYFIGLMEISNMIHIILNKGFATGNYKQSRENKACLLICAELHAHCCLNTYFVACNHFSAACSNTLLVVLVVIGKYLGCTMPVLVYGTRICNAEMVEIAK
ncbi:hypothetical protein KI387_009898, partial [Taxus chinensis]